MSKISYVSRQIKEAEAMTYGEFMESVESTLDEFHPDTPGYLVEVEPGKFSWFEAEAFEEDHHIIGDLEGLEPYQKRLMAERTILADNFSRLSKAFNKNTFLALPFLDRELLEKQHRAMDATLRVLNERISKFLH